MSTRRLGAFVVVLALSAGLFVGLDGRDAVSAPQVPSVRLLRSSPDVTLQRYGRGGVNLSLGMYLASVGGPFELHARRTDDGIVVTQVVRGPNDKLSVVRTLPTYKGSLRGGLKRFFTVDITDAGGTQVALLKLSMCPGGWDQGRIDDTGPDAPQYPGVTCFQRSRLTQATVWGIDAGWATSALAGKRVNLPEGTYTISVSITRRYVDAFNIPADAATTSVTATVKDSCDDYYVGGGGGHCEDFAFSTAEAPHHETAAKPPHVAPSASGLPDLIALPAFQATAWSQGRRDVLAFAANVWNAGPGPLVVEGFRRPDADVMDAYQNLYDDGERVGRHQVGTLEFDRRDGHHHWHFQDFARYRLVDRNKEKVVRSGKESFCLANTDAIDLTLPGANWQPDTTDLHSACGGAQALWIREVLDAGWGDTYFQWLPGQSFNITDVPNGVYFIEVTTNRLGRLHEVTTDNNTSYRKIRLRGVAGKRRVEEL